MRDRRRYEMDERSHTSREVFPVVLTGYAVGLALKYDILGTGFWDGVVALFYLISFAGAILAGIRRSHDLGRSGWFVLIMLIPFAGLYLLFKAGETGLNKYGSSPVASKG